MKHNNDRGRIYSISENTDEREITTYSVLEWVFRPITSPVLSQFLFCFCMHQLKKFYFVCNSCVGSNMNIDLI